MSVEPPAEVTEATSSSRLNLFEAFGVELEYMIVARESLDVLPVTDRLIEAESGQIQSEIDLGKISWSNELALHVVELKTTAPEADLTSLAGEFQQHIVQINRRLAAIDSGGQLMPSAMHPWMDPWREMQLWPHEYSSVYEAYNRIFDCRGHGWANLQSVHLNLPFNGDEQFGQLHAAIRLLLPILPALAASSPLKDGHLTGILDNRLDVYQGNSAIVPSLAGRVIPEPVFTEADYRRLIFQRMYDDIAPLDPDGVLQHEFLNSRGAIARFDRGSIEIRVIDIQECPAADLAVLQATVAVLQALCSEQWSTLASQKSMEVEPLYGILSACIRDADEATISDRAFLALFGFHGGHCTASELWRHLINQTAPTLNSSSARALEVILTRGPLARRLISGVQQKAGQRDSIHRIYAELCQALQNAEMYLP
ncbi:MAG: glutamate-cysteine ligase family protein [Planctomycetaceae bacterium]